MPTKVLILYVFAFYLKCVACFIRIPTINESNRKVERFVTKDDTPTTSVPTTIDEYKSYVQNTYGRYPLTITRGDGCRLYDESGKEYLDMVAGISTCALGHGDKEMAEVLYNQAKRLNHVSNLYFIPNQAKLAKWLVSNSCLERVFFCNSGAEANEAAIKLARKHARMKLGLDVPVIITARQSFHGRTLAAITATGQPKYQKDFGPLPKGFEYVAYNDSEELTKLVKSINFKGRISGALGLHRQGVAGILMEPLQGEGGVVPATKEYFKTIRNLCDETGALMMCDEVQTGMGRTGKLWGYENFDVEPDVLTSAKALGAGVPIGAMLCKAKCDVFQPGDHASTFGGNPLACAVGLLVASKLTSGNLLSNTQERGEQLRSGLGIVVEKYKDYFEGVRGMGLINGLVIKDEADLTAGEVVQKASDFGLLLVPAGNKVIRFVPPLIVGQSDIDEAIEKLEKAILASI